MKKQHSSAGFTLIEILVVIVIITILAGIVVGAAKYAITKGQRSRADSDIHMMENALESYKSDNGAYPPSTAIPNNVTQNSILLYNSLATGPKMYFTFKANQVRDGGNMILVTINCPTVPTNYTVSVTNVAVMDPFGMAYNYFNNPCGGGGQNNSATFDLWSYGPDNINGTADDITNWKQN